MLGADGRSSWVHGATALRPNCRRIAIAGSTLAILVATALLLAPASYSQSAINQYSPVQKAPGGGPGDSPAPGGEIVPGAEIGPAASKASIAPEPGIELPFTNYPLTPLIIALLILLAVGALLRIGLELHERYFQRN